MPVYDYECSKCEHRFELRQGYDADPVHPCPRCQARSSRQFHAVGVIYKGSGFYTTDYKRRESAPQGSSDTKSRSSKPSSTTAKENTASPSTDSPSTDSPSTDSPSTDNGD